MRGEVGGQVAMQSVVAILLLLLWGQMCAAAGRRGWACLFARCWQRPMNGVVLLFVKIATAAAAAALVC